MPDIVRKILVLACLVFLVPISSPALEVEQGKGRGKAEKKHDGKKPEFSLEFLIDFTSDDARRYAREAEFLGQKPLPPGIRKNLARGKPLPPGIAKQTLPASFVERLPAHDDYEWRRAGTDLVLVARSDNLVVEIAADIFR